MTAGPVSAGAGGAPGQGLVGRPDGQGERGGTGGVGTVNVELTALLEGGGGSYRWAAATTGSPSAAIYQLATELPVMAIGGFDGGDPSPTLEQFQAYVEAGDIHYYVGSERAGGPRGSSGSAWLIASWVADHYSATTVGGVDVYDLTSPA